MGMNERGGATHTRCTREQDGRVGRTKLELKFGWDEGVQLSHSLMGATRP